MAKKIGIVLALDGEREFTTAMKTAKSATKELDTELKGLKSEYKDNADSLDALTKKQDLLKQKQEALSNQMTQAKAGYANAASQVDKQREALEKLQQELGEAKDALSKMSAGTDEYKKQSSAVDQLSQSVARQTANLSTAMQRQNAWTAQEKQTEAAIRQNNTALQETESKMKGVSSAGDQTANSLDKVGDSAKNAANNGKTLGERLKEALTVAGGMLAAKAVQELGRKAVEAAKYVVKVGMSFEAAMSKVEALSGASGTQLDALSLKARELGASTQYSATEVAEAMANMALAGWDTQQMLSGIDGVLQLAASSQMDLAAASDAVAGYLAAFNMKASESGKLADIMATAQAKSKTTAQQLAEAYSTSATNMTQYGQECTTTTAALEAMASVNDTGSAAGTKLSAVMAQIVQKMKDGKIAIGDTSVSVKDSQGNFRDLVDIIEDVEHATDGMSETQRAAALSSTFNRTSLSAMNELLAVGSDKIRSYKQELENSSGAAQDMASTMTDNLKGAVTEFQSAAEGLGIAVYDGIKGPLTGAVDIGTAFVSGLTAAISPAKTELQTFMDEVAHTMEASRESAQAAKDTITQGLSDVGQLEYYKNLIVDLNEKEQLNEFEKYQLKAAVDALSGSIPELAGAFNDETGKIELQTQAIEDLITAKQQQIITDAKAKAEAQAMESVFQAELGRVQAESALTEAILQRDQAEQEAANGSLLAQDNLAALEEQVRSAQEQYDASNKEVENAKSVYSDYVSSVDQAAEAVMKDVEASYQSQKATREAAKEKEQQAGTIKKTGEAIIPYSEAMLKAKAAEEEEAKAAKEAEEKQKELAAAFGGTVPDIMDMSAAAKVATGSFKEYSYGIGDFIRSIGKMSEVQKLGNWFKEAVDLDEIRTAVHELQDIMTDAERTVTEGWTALKDQAKQTISFSISAEFDGGDDLTTEKMNANIQSQIEGYKQYYDNMTKLRALIAEGIITPEFYENISEQGTSAANEVQHMIYTIENQGEYGAEQLRSLSDGYMEAMNWQDTISAMLAGNAAAFSEGLKSLGSSDTEYEDLKTSIQRGLEGASETQRSQIDRLVEDAQTLGVKIPDGLQAGIESGEIDAEGTINQLSGAIEGTISGLAEVAKENGIAVPDGLAEGILSGEVTAQEAYSQLMSAIAQGTGGNDAAESGKEAGAEVGSGTAEGISGSVSEVESAAQSIVDSAKSAAETASANFNEAGVQGGAAYAVGLTSQQGTVSQAGGELAKGAADSARSASTEFQTAGTEGGNSFISGLTGTAGSANSAGRTVGAAGLVGAGSVIGQFQSVGAQMSAGIAVGIMARAGSIASAAAAVVSSALAAAKAAAAIQSPSKKFREEVGKMIGRGTALGIALTTKDNEKAAQTMIEKTMRAASDAAKKAQSKGDLNYLWDMVSDRAISNRFGVLSYTTSTTGKGKKKKTTQTAKSDADYYGDIYKAAQDYYDQLSLRQTQSVRSELKYWTKVRGQLKNGTDAYLDATKKIKALQAQMGTTEVAEAILDNYQLYYDMSAKAEVEYWEEVRKHYAAGTQERIDADKNYLGARKNYYDKLEDLDRDYAKDRESIEKDLAEKIKDLQDEYAKEVESTSRRIMEAFGLFEAFESKSVTGEELLFNIKSQAAGYADWMEQLTKLRGRGILSEELMKELEEKGPSDSAALHALMTLNDEQLREYNEAYAEKLAIANKEAIAENEDLRIETNNQIAELQEEVTETLRTLDYTYSKEREALSAGISDDILNLAKNIQEYAEDQTAALVSAFTSGGSKSESSTGQSVSEAVKADAGLTSESAGATTDFKAATTAAPAVVKKAAEAVKATGEISGIKAVLQKGNKNSNVGKLQRVLNKLGHKGADGKKLSVDNVFGNNTVAALKKFQKAMKISQTGKLDAATKRAFATKGYADGTLGLSKDQLIWMDEQLRSVGPEMIVRKADNAILTRGKAGDAIIPADLASNLFAWGAISPDDFRNRMSESAMNNRLAAGYRQSIRNDDEQTSVMQQMLALMAEFMPYIAQKGSLSIDGKAFAELTAGYTSQEMAARSRRRRA